MCELGRAVSELTGKTAVQPFRLWGGVKFVLITPRQDEL